VLSAISPFKAPSQLFDGLVIRTRIVDTNTGASTLNWNGTGAKAIKKNRGVDDLASGDLVTDDYPIFIYEQGTDIWELVTEPIESNYPSGYLRGFKVEQDSGDPGNDLKVFEGAARGENDLADIKIAKGSSIIKQIDANWAEGTNQGGFPNNITLTADTWYYCFAISKPNGLTDSGFDSDINASNLLTDTNVIAAGYIDYIKTGSILTDVSSNIIDFYMDLLPGGERMFWWKTTPIDYNQSNPSETPTLITLSAPPNTNTILNYYTFNAVLTYLESNIYSTRSTTPPGDDHRYSFSGQMLIYVDNNSQIYYNKTSGSGSITTVKLYTEGWIE